MLIRLLSVESIYLSIIQTDRALSQYTSTSNIFSSKSFWWYNFLSLHAAIIHDIVPPEIEATRYQSRGTRWRKRKILVLVTMILVTRSMIKIHSNNWNELSWDLIFATNVGSYVAKEPEHADSFCWWVK